MSSRRLLLPLLFWAAVCIWPATLRAAAQTGTLVVLNDGTRIETRDGFTIRGRVVLFTDTQGHLRSIPVREVDVKASQSAVATPAQESEPAADAEAAAPVLVLENKDLPSADEAQRKRSREQADQRRLELDRAAQRARAGRASGFGIEDAATRVARAARPGAGTSPTEGTATGLATVSHWSVAEARQTGGLQIVGAVINPSERSLDRVGIQVLMYDKDDKLVHNGRGFINATRLAPGAGSKFRYVDPSLKSLKGLRVEFKVTARALSWGSRPQVAADDIPTVNPPADGG